MFHRLAAATPVAGFLLIPTPAPATATSYRSAKAPHHGPAAHVQPSGGPGPAVEWADRMVGT